MKYQLKRQKAKFSIPRLIGRILVLLILIALIPAAYFLPSMLIKGQAADYYCRNIFQYVSILPNAINTVFPFSLTELFVVVGSFSLKANAEGLQQTLRNSGYDAQIVLNSAVSPAMYRVVATTFDSKVDAASSRDALQDKYPGAWLLYAK